MTSIHPTSGANGNGSEMLPDALARATTPENHPDSKQASPSKTFASINTTPRRLTGSSSASVAAAAAVASQTPTQMSPVSPSVMQTPASRPNPELTTPQSSFVGRPPSSVPTQQRMLQSTFLASTPGNSSAKRTHSGSPKVTRQDEPTTGIYTATYSGIPVFEMMVNGVAVMRRRHDSSLNATQILKVAGVDKSKRTKILEREILTGTHEKVQGGYGKYQGTWIPYERGADLCRQYSVFDILQPLLVFDSTNPGMENTPTKEQAMAARRKRISQYNPLNLDPPSTSSVLTFTNPLQVSSGLNTPLSHLANEALSNLSKPVYGNTARRSFDSTNEPPSKKQKESSTPTPEDNFVIDEEAIAKSSTPLEPLKPTDTPNFETSRQLITQVFVDTESSNLAQIFGGEERLKAVNLDVPIDDLQHTALHWAAVLARIPLVKDLIQHGANVLRANHAGESGLIRAVLVRNNSDASTFPQLLDLLYPAIPLVDNQGRSVLHHIAKTAAIKGRSDASRYYLSCLFEWIVNKGSTSNRLNLGRFISDIVNLQDKSGDTALNLAALTGNKHICQQLLEVGADPTIPNRAGLRPIDFGVRVSDFDLKKLDVGYALSNSTTLAARVSVQQQGPKTTDERKDERGEIVGVVNSLMSEVESVFEEEFKSKNDEIQRLHKELRESNAALETSRTRLEKLKGFSNSIAKDKRRAENLSRAITDEDAKFKAAEAHQGITNGGTINFDMEFNPDQPFLLKSLQKVYDAMRAADGTSVQIHEALVQQLKNGGEPDMPAKAFLKARIRAYKANEEKLKNFASELRGRSAELEQKFRRIVAQCASIEESQVDDLLEGLVQAVESDPAEVELSRVASFLQKVDDGVSF